MKICRAYHWMREPLPVWLVSFEKGGDLPDCLLRAASTDYDIAFMHKAAGLVLVLDKKGGNFKQR